MYNFTPDFSLPDLEAPLSFHLLKPKTLKLFLPFFLFSLSPYPTNSTDTTFRIYPDRILPPWSYIIIPCYKIAAAFVLLFLAPRTYHTRSYVFWSTFSLVPSPTVIASVSCFTCTALFSSSVAHQPEGLKAFAMLFTLPIMLLSQVFARLIHFLQFYNWISLLSWGIYWTLCKTADLFATQRSLFIISCFKFLNNTYHHVLLFIVSTYPLDGKPCMIEIFFLFRSTVVALVPRTRTSNSMCLTNICWVNWMNGGLRSYRLVNIIWQIFISLRSFNNWVRPVTLPLISVMLLFPHFILLPKFNYISFVRTFQEGGIHISNL